jgi:hypothetical protein
MISTDSYAAAGIMLTAVVIESETGMPSDAFFQLMEKLSKNPINIDPATGKWDPADKTARWYAENPEAREGLGARGLGLALWGRHLHAPGAAGLRGALGAKGDRLAVFGRDGGPFAAVEARLLAHDSIPSCTAALSSRRPSFATSRVHVLR